jgi:hypothetical protein
MDLQPFVGPWPFFSFLIFYTVGRTPWTGDQPVARPLPAHTGQHKHRINAHRHPCLKWDSYPRSQCFRPRGHCDWHNSESDPSVVQPVASRYTDWAIPALFRHSVRRKVSDTCFGLTDKGQKGLERNKTIDRKGKASSPFILTINAISFRDLHIVPNNLPRNFILQHHRLLNLKETGTPKELIYLFGMNERIRGGPY